MPVTRGVDFVLNVKGDADRKIAGLATASTAYAVAGKRAESTTAGLSKQIGGLKEATEKLQLGTLSRGIGMVQGALAAVANPAGAATVAIGGVAMASVAGAAALAKLVTSAKAWHDELMKAGQAENLLSPEEIADIERMQRGFGELGIELKRLAVIIAADLAPTVSRMVEQMVGWLNASEDLVSRINWTQFFGGMVLGFTNIEGKISGLVTLSESWLKILTKIGIMGPQVEAAFKVDPNRPKFGEMASGLSTGVQDAADRVPRGSSSTKPRDRSGDVQIDMSEEEEEQTRLFRDAQDKARDTLRLAEEAAKMREKTLEQAEELTAKITEMQSGLKMALVNQSLGAVAAIGDAGDLATMVGNAIAPGMGTAVAAGIDIAMNANSVLKEVRQGLIRGPEMIVDGITRMVSQGIPRFIKALPRILESLNLLKLGLAITKAIIEAIPRLVAAIAIAFFQAIKEAFERVVDFFRGGEDRNFLTGRREKVLGTSFKRGEFSLFGFGNADDDPNAGETGHGKRGHGSGSRMDRMSRMTGGYIDRTGRYLLHAGERVVPPTGASTSAAMSAMKGGGKGGTVNVTIGTAVGMDARELARWIRRELGDYGSGATLTPRGA